MIRRAHARKAAEAVEVTAPPLVPVVTTTAVLPPPVIVRHPDLVAEVACETLADPTGHVIVLEPDIWAAVDVLPTALVAEQFAIRSRDVRFRAARVDAMSLLTAEARSPAVVLEPPPSAPARPAILDLVRRRATPVSDVPRELLQRWLLALYRASGAASPADLELVGAFERVPGGAIQSIAIDRGELAIRVNPGARPRAATLVVGRRRGSSDLIPVELPN